MGLPRGRQLLELFLIAGAGGLALWFGATSELAGPLLGVGYAILVTPSMSTRWSRPIACFAAGFLGFAYAINLSLLQHAWFALVLIPVMLMWHYVLLAVLVRWLWRATQWPAWIVLPLAAGAEEWIRPLVGVGDYNMYQAGTFLARLPVLIQVAELIGGLGLTVLWMIPLGVLVEWVRFRWLREQGTEKRVAARGALIALAVSLSVVGYGAARLNGMSFSNGPKLALVQASAEHTLESTREDVRVQRLLTERFVSPGTVDLVVWPENSIFLPYRESAEYQNVVRALATSRRALMLFGTQDVGPDGKRPTASAFLVNQEGRELGRYDKMILFPFTERRAFSFLETVFPWLDHQLRDLTRRAWGAAPDGWAGQEPVVMTAPVADGSWRFYTPLCYDSCSAALGREAVRGGAQFFINMTSEGWHGWGISNNQLAVNILRAVENRVGVVRVGNSGPSCFVLPNGRVDQYLIGINYHRKRLDQGVLVHQVKLGPEAPTVYTRFGGMIDALWPSGWLLAVAAGLLKRRHTGRKMPT